MPDFSLDSPAYKFTQPRWGLFAENFGKNWLIYSTACLKSALQMSGRSCTVGTPHRAATEPGTGGLAGPCLGEHKNIKPSFPRRYGSPEAGGPAAQHQNVARNLFHIAPHLAERGVYESLR